MGMTCALSQWELDEMAYLRGCGWSRSSLASWYRMSVRNVDRLLRKMEREREPLRADSSPARAKVD